MPEFRLNFIHIVYKIYTMSFIRKIRKGDKIYLAEVENTWSNGKCVQRYIRYVGKEADGKTILSSSISNIEIDQVKRVRQEILTFLGSQNEPAIEPLIVKETEGNTALKP